MRGAGPKTRLGATMIIIASKYLIRGGALVLVACAVLHSLAWTRVQADFAPAGGATGALVWVFLSVRFLVSAGRVAFGAAPGNRGAWASHAAASHRVPVACRTVAV